MLENWYKTKKEDILSQLKDVTKDVENAVNSCHVNFKDNRYSLHFKVTLSGSLGPTGLGAGWLEDWEIEEALAKRLATFQDSKIKNTVKETILSNFENFTVNTISEEVLYDDNKHTYLSFHLHIDGKMVKDSRGKDMWASYDGTYEKTCIMLLTPDIERYFQTEEELQEYLKSPDYEESNDPF